MSIDPQQDGSISIPTPIRRIEYYLAALAGEEVDLPDPVTRLETYLKAWAERSGKNG